MNIATAQIVRQTADFDTIVSGMNEETIGKVRTRGDAIVLVKSLAAADDESTEWVEEFADAIMRKKKDMQDEAAAASARHRATQKRHHG